MAAVAIAAAVDDGPAAPASATSSAPGDSRETSEVAASTLDVTLGDLFVEPGTLSAAAGSDLTLRVTNTGGIEHDLSLEGGAVTPRLAAGASADLHLGALDAGTYTLICTVPGHADAGMTTTLTVAEGAAAARDQSGSAAHTMTSEEMDASYTAGVEAFLDGSGATPGKGNVLMAPVMDGNVKVFELTASVFEWEVAPGDVREAWGYNGMVPGPQIRVQVGDTVRIVLHNELPESTALHYHGVLVPNEMDGVPGVTQPLVKPGESYTYEFTVRNSGSHMYHSHMNGAFQIPAGLLGAFVVEDDLTPVADQDYVMILNDGPLGYTLNGKGFPATEPLVLQQGQQVRIRYMNEGLQIHPMHLHGIPQLVISKDGYPLPQPYTADTVLVAPGERIDVLVNATELGAWAFHCHILTHAETEAGMFGMVTAMVVTQ